MRYFKLLFLLISLMFLTSFRTKKEPTDIKEYGFKGKVKSVTIIRYGYIVKRSEPLKEIEKNILYKRTMLFNKQGNIYRMITTNTHQGILNKATINYTFKDNRKDKFESLDIKGSTFEKGSYNWHNNYNYSVESKDSSGAISRGTYKLNNKFRDIGGSYKYIIDGDLIFEEEYENILDKKGKIIKSTTLDHTYKTERTIEIKYKEEDKKGNNTKIEVFNEKSKELIKISKRRFEYY